MTRKRLLQNLALVVVTVLVMGVALEAGYRVYLYFRLQEFIGAPGTLKVADVPFHEIDEAIGFRFVRDTTVGFAWITSDGEIIERHEFVTNNAGWISRNDYSEVKSEDEFRIVVLGDSVTANMENSLTWVDELAELLNADADLKALLGVETISVYSFGQPGTGFDQFAVVFEEEASRYNPDLVVVNFIVNDIGRPFVWRDAEPLEGDFARTTQCTVSPVDEQRCNPLMIFTLPETVWDNPAQVTAIRDDFVRQQLHELPWFSLHSEVLARVFGGRRLVVGTRQRDNNDGNTTRREPPADFDLAVSESTVALERIEAGSSEFLALLHPVGDDLYEPEAQQEMLEIAGRMSSVPLVTMIDYMPEVSEDGVNEWFHYPYDPHPNDEGLRVYAQAVYEMLVTDYWDVR